MRTIDHATFAADMNRKVLKLHSPVKIACFFVGNLIPDYSYHTYMQSIGHNFRTARKKLLLAWQCRHFHGENAAFYFRMGVATHYLCDSFTFPHTASFKGTMKQHIEYEHSMHDIFHEGTAYFPHGVPIFQAPDECMRYLERLHAEYLKMEKKSPVVDLSWIVSANITAVLSSLSIPRQQRIWAKEILIG